MSCNWSGDVELIPRWIDIKVVDRYKGRVNM